MPRNPFGDYSTVDLSSVYNASAQPNGVTQPGTSPGTTPGGTPITQPGTTTTTQQPDSINGYAQGTPQYDALYNPDQPYLDVSGSGGVNYSPNQARQWWDQWFQHPVNLLTVDPGMLPGSLVLSPEEIQRAQQMQLDGTLPAAPADYNPLGLDVTQGSNGLGPFGGYGSAAAALQASPALSSFGIGTPAQQQYINTLKGLGIENPVYSGPGVGYNQVDAYNQAVQAGTAGADRKSVV